MCCKKVHFSYFLCVFFVCNFLKNFNSMFLCFVCFFPFYNQGMSSNFIILRKEVTRVLNIKIRIQDAAKPLWVCGLQHQYREKNPQIIIKKNVYNSFLLLDFISFVVIVISVVIVVVIIVLIVRVIFIVTITFTIR